MAYIKPKTLSWGASPDAVSYNFYWAIPPSALDPVNPMANPNVKVLGNILFLPLPIPELADVNGNVQMGIGAVDDAGNIADLSVGTFPLRFRAPQPAGPLSMV
jgi:hypothetical protein